jgi:hypothetical protein
MTGALSVTDAPEHDATEAVIVACPATPPDDDAVKFADVCPAGTVTELVTLTPGLPLARFTTNPPEGAGAVRVTVP